MKALKISALALVLVAAAPLAYAQSASGDWELTVDTPQGSNTLNVALTQSGEAVTGTLSSPLGSVPLKGTATGGDVTVAADIDIQGTALTLTFKGKVEGDTFNGSVQFGDFGEGPFTGKRVTANASATPPSGASPAAAARPAAATARTAAATAPAAGAANAGAAGDASGTWDITLSLAGAGDFPMTATFTQAGDKVTGTLSSQAGDVPVNGTMSGNALNLTFTAQTPAGEIPVTMTGTLAGGAFSGKAAIEGLGEADWTGKRAQQ